MINVVELSKKLISKRSITPNDDGCQNIIIDVIRDLNFKIDHFKSGRVDNLLAIKGDGVPVFVFSGHTDVVDPGSLQDWKYNPFVPTIVDKTLYGRGAVDMKCSLAAMITSTYEFIKRNPNLKGTICFAITSGEEGIHSFDGTPEILDRLQDQCNKIDWCLVGEPSSEKTFGDTIKVGRRGSLTGYLSLYGNSGHVAYPNSVNNPIHLAVRILNRLVEKKWDQGDNLFEPTSLQISSFSSNTIDANVTPRELKIILNFRFNPRSKVEFFKQYVEKELREHNLQYNIEWKLFGEPYFTHSCKLIDVAKEALNKITRVNPKLSTSGGTSDGRFFSKNDIDVIEIGLLNETIHKINERTKVNDIVMLEKTYLQILESLFESK